MDKGDLATWISAGVALCFSVAALIVSVKALRWQREGALIAERAQKFIEERHEEDRARADEDARRVRWEVERSGDAGFLLRNITENPVTGVTIDGDQFDGFGRDLPTGVDVPGFGSVDFIVFSAAGHDAPNEVWVTWDGQEKPVAVPTPQWF